jgi:hypothetical protein
LTRAQRLSGLALILAQSCPRPVIRRRRQWLGDSPVQRWNALLKLLWSLNPRRNATSAIEG